MWMKTPPAARLWNLKNWSARSLLIRWRVNQPLSSVSSFSRLWTIEDSFESRSRGLEFKKPCLSLNPKPLADHQKRNAIPQGIAISHLSRIPLSVSAP
jgi:hypothetical protein